MTPGYKVGKKKYMYNKKRAKPTQWSVCQRNQYKKGSFGLRKPPGARFTNATSCFEPGPLEPYRDSLWNHLEKQNNQVSFLV
jgi:hypothetical protein